MDLRDLARLSQGAAYAAILAPADGDRELAQAIDELRARGEVVVRQLGANEPAPEGVDRVLRKVDGRWQVVALD